MAVTDCQALGGESLDSVRSLYLELADQLGVDLRLSVRLSDLWDDRRAPNLNLQMFVEDHVLRDAQQPVVWALDRVDRLFSHPVSASLFSLFRAWHNTRSTRPDVPWSLLTLILVYAAEDQELIADPNQSPFNVGERINLEDFTFQEASELNAPCDPPPLAKPGEVQKLFDLLSGQPTRAAPSGTYAMKVSWMKCSPRRRTGKPLRAAAADLQRGGKTRLCVSS